MATKKGLTWDDIEARKIRAESFTRDVLGDEDRADDIANESLASYANRRGFRVVENSSNRSVSVLKSNLNQMTKRDLAERVRELEDENRSLNEKLDSIWDLASADDVEEDDEDDELDDDDGD